MATNFICLDDPITILQKEWCLTAVSKDTKESSPSATASRINAPIPPARR